MVSATEIERRMKTIRTAMEAEGLEALVVCGTEYTGFEGAVRYVSGFEIVHRHVYVLMELDRDPHLIFPAEARWIGDKEKPWVRDHIWADIPGNWIRQYLENRGTKRLGVYGLDYVMTVNDFRALNEGSFQVIPFDLQFDLARAVKSEEELIGVRNSMKVIEKGFWKLLEKYEPGMTEAEIMAPAVECFFAGGAGPRMMNIVLSGTDGQAEAHFKVPGGRVVNADDLLLYSLEVTAEEGYWVEFSRPVIRGELSKVSNAMKEIYPEAMEAARSVMREGELASTVHRAGAEVLANHGFELGHLTGHSIGMTMLEHPAIGSSVDIELKENMVISYHPQVVDQEGTVCLYTQDTFRVGQEQGENLTNIPWQLYRGGELPPNG